LQRSEDIAVVVDNVDNRCWSSRDHQESSSGLWWFA
jgi:hypothetical protein